MMVQSSQNKKAAAQRNFAAPPSLYAENHSLGEWFKRRLVPIMQTRKTPFAKIEERSANCTSKQREVIQNERRK